MFIAYSYIHLNRGQNSWPHKLHCDLKFYSRAHIRMIICQGFCRHDNVENDVIQNLSITLRYLCIKINDRSAGK